MRPTLSIRSVQVADALTWERMRYTLWPGEDERHGEVTAAFFHGPLADPLEVLLAESPGGRVIAFVELSLRTDLPGPLGKRVGYVEGLYVVPDMRGQGVACNYYKRRAQGHANKAAPISPVTAMTASL